MGFVTPKGVTFFMSEGHKTTAPKARKVPHPEDVGGFFAHSVRGARPKDAILSPEG